MYRKFLKSILDRLVALILMLVLSPVFLLVFLVLFVQNRGKPFFFQERPGYHHRSFKIIKFKTMNDKKDVTGKLLPDVERITPLGKFVRKSSMDELPQLINVLKGDMSIVGPRPLLFKYIPLYSAEQDRRHNVKPGITGWAQVNGRNSISWTAKFKFDVEYVDKLSFLLDLEILWLTIEKVIKSEGVNQSEARPMQPFNGKN
jgi:lipopolysaccharide/colanic/teichoic acid biosynthesis glycosyltransferase